MEKGFYQHRIGILLLFFLGSSILSAVEVSIPNLELMSWGRLEEGTFGLYSRGYLEVALLGAERGFGGKAEFLFEDSNLEESATLPSSYDQSALEQAFRKTLRVKSLSVEMKQIFQLPVSMVYFTGSTDVIGSGKVFTSVFGLASLASPVHGYLYFPKGIQYEGIHTIAGTGLKLYTDKAFETLFLSAYTYQDQYLGKGKYSSDLWIAFNFEGLQLETFIGASYPISTYGLYRAGLLFHYKTPEGGAFFTQIGVPRWDPKEDTRFTVDLFYFLFEPRVQIGLFGVSITFFWHPSYYLQTATGESGITDLYIRFSYGKQPQTSWVGGIENGVTLQTNAGEQITYRLTPYVSILTSGVQWEFRINFNLYPYHWNSLIQTFVGAKTSF
ncbi:MAG: hypothetical protein N2442_05435 [Spirochaetes bacterium]|nr:hypothetical protein [Spirochaetota bacterium]